MRQKRPSHPSFGRNLRAIRERHGLTLRALSKELDVSYSEIQRWEKTGQRPKPEYERRLREYFRIESFEARPAEFDAVMGLMTSPHVVAIKRSDFRNQVIDLAKNATSFIRYVRLSRSAPDFDGIRPLELSDDAFQNRLRIGEVTFDSVEIFYEPKRLEEAVVDVHKFPEAYRCAYFIAPYREFPAINLRSFDDKIFVLESLNRNAEGHALLFSDLEPILSFLRMYWNDLRAKARPIKEPMLYERAKDILEELSPRPPDIGFLLRQIGRRIGKLW